ncbi:2-dehydropantoate 2-reductase [Shewanella psychropiezotolerans]|uniref:2-dehydropantoate 2-reductase n=1 Tax=Shewanella psychropiezotolerans TaxID=2593655 RepID=A0ABX5WV29_9GAMM|nr:MULTISPECIES: 2-dehydropantoate 2-reductase [Shewanella]MPY22790.1 2-dehydropantoate 2-reductase [Shewanella sp. YLB-07]QDO82934.1 2-dehydropantoate 2-reductase [Shewanella psychropiezotolerans]
MYNPSIAILGAGAIGQLIYHQLVRAELSPYFITRGKTQGKQVLTLTHLDGHETESRAHTVSITTSDKQESECLLLSKTQLLIVCVKSYQVKDALKAVISQLPRNCHILLLHNGLGSHLEVEPFLQGRGLSLGTTSQGAFKQSTWQIKQTGTGITQIGHLSGPSMPSDLKPVLLSAIPNGEWCEPILPFLWQKLAINAAINPLTAIDNCANGALAAPQYEQRICDIVTELVDVAMATGVELNKLALTNRVYSVIELTSANFSSMHQDVANKRRTEIDSINGYIVERAKEHGLTAKVNLSLLNRIKAIEADYLV